MLWCAAVRELREETGLVGTVVDSTTTDFFSDPWKSNETGRYVVMHVDANDPVNASPVQMLEPEEVLRILSIASRNAQSYFLFSNCFQQHIELVIVPVRGLKERLDRYNREHGLALDGRLYAFALALTLCGRA